MAKNDKNLLENGKNDKKKYKTAGLIVKGKKWMKKLTEEMAKKKKKL